MPKKTYIKSLFHKALALEAYAYDLAEAAQAARVAYALAINAKDRKTRDEKTAEGDDAVDSIETIVEETMDKAADLAAEKKK